MTKRKLAKTHQEPNSFDFIEDEETIHDEGAMLGMMSEFVEAIRHQQQLSFDLTKLIVASHPTLSADDILTTFKRASTLVSEQSPLKDMLEKM